MPDAVSVSDGVSRDEVRAMGYAEPRWVSDELGWCGLSPMLFTVGLVVGISPVCFSHRYCFPDYASASRALQAWDGGGDPPGPWIKEKLSGRCNPMAAYWGHHG
ncbi:MAG: hypothetical protein RLO53_07710 [Salinisphaeraceae bacterium]